MIQFIANTIQVKAICIKNIVKIIIHTYINIINMDSTINDRVKMIMVHFNLSQTKFASSLNCSQTTITNIVGGRKNKPGFELSTSILETYNVSADWFFHNKGEMFKNEVANAEEVSTLKMKLEKAYAKIKTIKEEKDNLNFALGQIKSMIANQTGAISGKLSGVSLSQLVPIFFDFGLLNGTPRYVSKS